MTVREVKVCLLGDIGVGKTSLVGRFVHDTFSQNITTTLGASFMSKTLTVDTTTIKFQIWDTAGQERYRSLLPMYYRNAAAAVVVYDITNEGSFTVLQDWIAELHRLGPQNMVLAIAGNKSDLEDKREISFEQGQSYATEMNAIFAETSALTSQNVEEVFVEITRKLPLDSLNNLPSGVSLLRHPNPPPKSSTCCDR